MTFQLDVSKLDNFGEISGADFILVTTDELASKLDLVDTKKAYSSLIKECVTNYNQFEEALSSKFPEKAHILVVLPSIYVASPPPEVLGKYRKLATLACFSTPTSIESIFHFLEQATRTDSAMQEKIADRFFEVGESAKHIKFVNEEYGTSAVFKHLSDDLTWHEQIGKLDWGEQQLLPSGEVSTLPVSVFGEDIKSKLDLNGEILLKGQPVLHAGNVSFLRKDQDRIFNALNSITEHPLKLEVKQGEIQHVTAISSKGKGSADMLNALFDVDSRFRTIIELGFGINTNLELFPGNQAMNEVYGGKSGVIHYGIGLLPFTQYHIDFICPDTRVMDNNGIPLVGE
ncbi:hypothetical protein CEE45_16555 [Candidatus Heimdallarchaeota archaeon B3_Heim]|nr:MAG: hypothetical protein CEE45_16555 [Candidatus Heimdallarchaeota archaeon B3_Heim]